MTVRHRFHGDPARFEATARFVADRFGSRIRFIADVAGGQGMLSRILTKHYNYDAEVVDPRGFTLRGVRSKATEYTSQLASYYDLVVGLHPDEALREVVASAPTTPVVVVPCCNFWTRDERLGRDALLDRIGSWLGEAGVRWEHIELGFRGPKNTGIVTIPR